nr:unnamed protein product [Digitaria exilis]
MAASRHPAPAPIFVLGGQVDVDVDIFAAHPGPEWTKIECATKRAYGCGDLAKEALQGLTLYAHLGGGDDPLFSSSSLAIRMTDTARRGFESELDLIHPRGDTRVACHHFICCPRKGTPCYQTIATGLVQIAGDREGLTVVFLLFRRDPRAELAYYLAYDHAAASLCLLPHVPDPVEAVSSVKPVAKRNGAGGDFELFVMACELSSSSVPPRHFLCACTAETRANAASDGTVEESFSAHVVFPFKTMGIWAGLSRGLMYCDLDTTSDGDVGFGFIQLPYECLLDTMQEEMAEKVAYQPMEVTRTMGCVDSSITFVCIDPAREYANDLVKVGNMQMTCAHGGGASF